jgi:hypothetical protein
VGGHWLSVRQAEFEAVLKEQMIQRGMSAQEIVRVVQASLESTDRCPEPGSTRHSSVDKRWLWLAVGLPVALFVLCGGFMMAMASLAVVASDDATSLIVDESLRVPDDGR